MVVKQPPVEVAAETQESGPRMTYEEYLKWANEDLRTEWVNGEVIIQMPLKPLHQRLSEFLDRILGLFIGVFGLGVLHTAPIEVKLWADGPSREPDLLFVSNEHLDRLTPERVVGAPDLVVEIVSDDSVHRDRVDKFDQYEAAGVPEYWIIDNRPDQHRAWFYRLDTNGQYQQVAVGTDGVYRSTVLPGFWLRLDWLWSESPNELSALAEIIGPEQFAEALRRASSK
ncbi:MAG: Uma2 family endonuclease [Chloroflexi bacterium]|nr:Uma2 family endonuclease [Chloroflexota bacterium]